MSLSRTLALALGIAVFAPTVYAAPKDDEEEEEDSGDDEGGDDEGGDDEGGDDEGDEDEASDEDEAEAEPKAKGPKKKKDEPFVKQNLSGHDLGTTKKENVFEKDRFFADKTDSDKTEKGTLIQGSLSSSSFAFTESGGEYATVGPTPLGENNARFSRMFTELRLQTDFRHIKASRWEARVDARVRVVNQPEDAVGEGTISVDPTRVQSGFNGTNEYDIRELWLYRSGKRSDLFLGRQFVPDLGGVKFDGLRIDYASSRKLTFIGFGGLYPLRGSRSITTDYQPLKDNEYNPTGRLVGAGGFGAAYRTVNSYGAIGGVALVPFAGETPRIFVTSTGYLRNGATLDVYHFALVDLYGSQGAGLTNLSAGVNYKPAQRLRITANVNRVDVDTLAVQANAFLNQADATTVVGQEAVQNETYFRRLATNVGRVGVSAGLGELQRFELSTHVAYRYRPAVAIPVGDQLNPIMGKPATVNLQGTRGIDVFASIVDRRSFAKLRLGADVTRSIGIGGDDAIAFNRSNVLAVRVFAGREIKDGQGEWEAEVGYSTTRDSATAIDCANIYSCYGSSTGSILSFGGNVFYRVNRDWIAIGSAYVSRQQLTHNYTGMPVADPSVLGLMGFFRIAYRF